MKLLRAVGSVLVLATCNDSTPDTGPNDSDTSGEETSYARLNLALSVANGDDSARRRGDGDPPEDSDPPEDAWQGVYALGSGLESLRLFITSIRICEDLQLEGTAIGPGTNCLDLYRGPMGHDILSNTAQIADALTAAADVEDGYIDIMDATSRAALSQPVELGTEHAHAYNYAVVSWAVPIKTTATLVHPRDGVTSMLYTKPSAAGRCQVNGQPEYDCSISTSPLSEAPAAETIFSGRADAVIRFQRPLTITDADIETERQFALRLAFNPHGLVQGVVSPGATNFPPLTDNIIGNGQNVGNSIALVGAQLAAVVLPSADDAVMRESYVATVDKSGGGTFDLRVELYSVQSDGERTVYGVSTATLPNADTSGYLVGYYPIYAVETNTDGSINLLDYEGTAQISNLVRGEAVEDVVTAQVRCEPVNMACEIGSSAMTSFRLAAYEALE